MRSGVGQAQGRLSASSVALSLPEPHECWLLLYHGAEVPRLKLCRSGVERIVIMSASVTSSPHIGRSQTYLRSWRGPAVVTLVGAGALIFDALSPQPVSVTAVYVGLVLIGFWLRDPRSALALALLATPLIIIGHWTSVPSNIPEWESWANRGMSIGSVWLAAVFVWRIRVLEQELQRQIAIADNQARESELL